MTNNSYHIPVLLHAVLDGLAIKAGGTYVDVTFGGGGHSREILKQLEDGKLVAFDQDPDAAANVPNDERLVFVPQNFQYLKNYLRMYNLIPVDGILGDLGVSSHQFDQAERGFSIRHNARLDMRMNQESGLSALQVLNKYPEEKLAAIFAQYGEIKGSYRLAKAIVVARETEKIEWVDDLKRVTEKFAQKGKENRFYAQLFQALRIEVNQELEVLKDFLKQAVEVLKPGGRLVVISYHSLEDRLVKNFIKTGNFEGKEEKDFYGNLIRPLQPVNRKVIIPTLEEIEINNRARSAKMRIAEKI